MDLLEGKLQRLRELRALQCCRHIDHEIKTWLNNIEQPPPPPPPPELIASSTATAATTIPTATPTKLSIEATKQQTSTLEPTPTQPPLLPTTTEETTATTLASTTTTTDPAPTSITSNSLTLTTDAATPSVTSSSSSSSSSAAAAAAATTTTTTTPAPTHIAFTNSNNTLATPTTTTKTSLPHLTSQEIGAHDEKTIGCFLANLKHLESLDSDATESTSSNDSYDELEGFSHEEIPPKRILQHPYNKSSNYPSNNVTTVQQRQQRMSTSAIAQQLQQQTHQGNSLSQRRASHQPNSIDGSSSMNANDCSSSIAYMSDLKQKAIWKWAQERSRLACKWTWLQAQIADLEFRVRGQNEAWVQARSRKMPPVPQTLPESTCSRTVPLNKDFRQRRLIKSSQILSDSSKSSVKFAHVPCVCSSLPQTVAPCLSCKGKYNYLKQSEGENAPILERASQLDPGCHPVLSFPDDITLGSQLSYLLRQETVIRKPTKGKPGRKKGSTTANHSAAANIAAAANNDDKSSGNKHANKKGKYYQGMSNRQAGHAQSSHHLKNPSQTMIASNKLKRKYRKHSNNPTNNYDSNNWFNNGTAYHGHNSNSTKRNKRIRSASSMNESSLHSDSSNPYRPNHFTQANNTTARNVTRRRRSEQSAYDIDNIVIPFSVAATTRVEILEYKEIMTPSWRVWENGTCLNETTNNVVVSEPSLPEEDIEDTSDEAYIQRHTRGEHEEKKRFSLKPPPKNVESSANTTTTTTTTTTNANAVPRE